MCDYDIVNISKSMVCPKMTAEKYSRRDKYYKLKLIDSEKTNMLPILKMLAVVLSIKL